MPGLPWLGRDLPIPLLSPMGQDLEEKLKRRVAPLEVKRRVSHPHESGMRNVKSPDNAFLLNGFSGHNQESFLFRFLAPIAEGN